MRRFALAFVFALGACAGIVGIDEDFPLPPLAKDGGVDAFVSDAPAEAGLDAEPDAANELEFVLCEPAPCVCKKEPVAGAENELFKDVLPSAIESESVNALHAQGIVSGCEASPLLFCPSCLLSRRVLAKWIVLATRVPLVEPASPTFTDVYKNDPDYAYIETAFEHDFVDGFPDGTFKPNAAISRGSTAVIVAKAAALPIPDPLPQSFTDVTPSAWWHPSIEALFAACVTTGCDTNGPQFCPDKLITRRGAAVIVARAFQFVTPECTPDP